MTLDKKVTIRALGRDLNSHYHADTGNRVWPGGLTAKCHDVAGVPIVPKARKPRGAK